MRAILMLTAFALAAAAADAPPISGDWMGTITFNGIDQHLAIHVKNAGAAWTGSMDAVDSGVKGIPLASIRVADSKFTFAVPSIAGSYEGVLDAKTGAIAGTWSQSGLKLPLE